MTKKEFIKKWGSDYLNLRRIFIKDLNSVIKNSIIKNGDIMGECPNCLELLQYGLSDKTLKSMKDSGFFRGKK